MKKLKLTNEDKTRKLATKASGALLRSASRDWDVAVDCAKKAAALEVLGHNRARACGLKLIEAAGHEQASFEFYRARRENGSIPKSMSFDAVKFCVHLARNYSKPFETLQEARATQRTFFEVFGHCEPPARIAEQQAHESNPWSEFVSAASSFTSLFSKLETDAMDSWGKDKLSKFVRETEPIVNAHQRAKSLL